MDKVTSKYLIMLVKITIVLLFILSACWVDAECTLNFSGCTVRVMGDVLPGLERLPAKGIIIYEGESLAMELFSVQNPKDSHESWYYLFAYNPERPRQEREVILIYVDNDLGTRWWVDQDYFDGKKALRILTPVLKRPDLRKLIQMRLNGFKYEL